jgi:hypothetical protein
MEFTLNSKYACVAIAANGDVESVAYSGCIDNINLRMAHGQLVRKVSKSWPLRLKDALQECVSKKVPKLLDEGYERAQALKIAYSMCGEKTNPKGPPSEEDPAESAAEESGLEEEPSEDGSVPHGAACAMKLIDYIEEDLGSLEPEVAEFFHGLLDDLMTWAKDRYPDQHFGGEETAKPDEVHDDETEDEESTEEILADYRSINTSQIKALTKTGLAEISLASKHLGVLSRMPSKGAFTKSLKEHTRQHAEALRRLHDGAMPQRQAKSVNLDMTQEQHSEMLAALEGMDKKLKGIEDSHFRMTGDQL